MLLPLQVRPLLDVKLKEASVAGVVDRKPRSPPKPRSSSALRKGLP